MVAFFALLILPGCVATAEKRHDSGGAPRAASDCLVEELPEQDTSVGIDAGLCPDFWGTVTEGSTRLWSLSEGGGSISLTTTSISGYAVMEERGDRFSSEESYWQSCQSRQLTCDDVGVSILSLHIEFLQTDEGGTEEGWYDEAFDPPVLMMPAGAVAGSIWTSAFNYDHTDSDGDSYSMSWTNENELVAADDVTVPAGTFPTVEWRDSNGSVMRQAAGPGTVRIDYNTGLPWAELTNYRL